jgi:cobalt-zinc-cadmium efflux system outer membrane protein
MKTLCVALCLSALLLPAGMSRAQTQAGNEMFPGIGAVLGEPKPAVATGPALTLDEIQQIALAENPEIHVAVRRVTMAEAHVPTTGTLEDPQLMVREWQVPLSKPWDYNAAQNMLMVGRSLTGPGKRGLQTSIARSDVEAMKDDLEATRLRVRVEVRKAFYDLLLTQEELRIHDQHVEIARQAIEAARIKYTVGKVPQQDILKAQLAMMRLAEHMIHFERDADVARAQMNTLLGRDPSTPLNLQGDFGVDAVLPSDKALEQLAQQARPDLLAAQVAVEKSAQEEALTKKAFVPDFSVAAGYMRMPTGSDFRDNYMLEGSMSLPWLNRRKHNAEIAESAAKVNEQDAEVAAARTAAFGQIEEALAEARAAQRLARVYSDTLRPQAEETLHAAVIAYENNQTDLLDLLDSQMTVIDIDLSSFQAMGDFAARWSELELAVGAPLESVQPGAPEAKP